MKSLEAASPTLEEAVDQAFAGQWVSNLTVDKHGFKLRPIVVTPIDIGVRIEGVFSHRIVSKDDRVHYVVVAEKGKAPRSEITKIEYRGLKDNAAVKFADKHIASGIIDIVGDAQKWRIGSWEAAAQKVVDVMAQRLAREIRN